MRVEAKTPRLLALLSVMALIVMAAGACVPPGSTPALLKIGLVAPFEGEYRSQGYEMLYGVRLALRERNDAPGSRDYRVLLVAYNDWNEPEEAALAARKLAADGDVVGVIGHASERATAAAAPVYADAGLPLVVPWSVSAGLGDCDGGRVLLAATSEEMAAHVEARAGQDGLYVLEENPPGGLHVPVGEAVYLQMEGVEAGEAVISLRDAGFEGAVYGGAGLVGEQFAQVAGEDAYGVFYALPAPHRYDTTPLLGAFAEAYGEMAGFPPGARGALAYDAANVLLDALAEDGRAGNLCGVAREGVSGGIRFDGEGRRIDAPLRLCSTGREGGVTCEF